MSIRSTAETLREGSGGVECRGQHQGPQPGRKGAPSCADDAVVSGTSACGRNGQKHHQRSLVSLSLKIKPQTLPARGPKSSRRARAVVLWKVPEKSLSFVARSKSSVNGLDPIKC